MRYFPLPLYLHLLLLLVSFCSVLICVQKTISMKVLLLRVTNSLRHIKYFVRGCIHSLFVSRALTRSLVPRSFGFLTQTAREYYPVHRTFYDVNYIYVLFNVSFFQGRITALYNITADPEERNDLSSIFPELVKKLELRLREHEETVVQPLLMVTPKDKRAKEAAEKNGVWGPWLDESNSFEGNWNVRTLMFFFIGCIIALLCWFVSNQWNTIYPFWKQSYIPYIALQYLESERLQNTRPLHSQVSEAFEERGIDITMDSFVTYQYVNKWTGILKSSLSEIPCLVLLEKEIIRIMKKKM